MLYEVERILLSATVCTVHTAHSTTMFKTMSCLEFTPAAISALLLSLLFILNDAITPSTEVNAEEREEEEEEEEKTCREFSDAH